MAGKNQYRRGRTQNRLSMFLAVLVVIILMAAIAVISSRLTVQLEERNRQCVNLEKEIEEQKKRADELEEYEKYVQTDQFKEKMAREKLGMVKDGEIVFEDEGSR